MITHDRIENMANEMRTAIHTIYCDRRERCGEPAVRLMGFVLVKHVMREAGVSRHEALNIIADALGYKQPLLTQAF